MAGIYVHIPFCASRCSYCDFYSTLQGRQQGRRYVRALLAEAKMRRWELDGQTVTTLYLGGGTPSQLPAELLTRLVDGLRKCYDLSHVEEFTIEANPDDVTAEWCAALAQLGVNRVSMGVQSLDDKLLRLIGRRHTARQAVEAVEALRRAGIGNVSIDLIYALPGQSVDGWARTLDQALALQPQHLSAYWLTYEEGTRLWQQRELGAVAEVSEQDGLAMCRLLVERMQTAGYEHYEISNFALPGFRSRHNASYWDGTPYLGLGAAAHSYDGNDVRYYNPCDLSLYLETVLEHDERPCSSEYLSWQERYDERVMLGLRTAQGIEGQRLKEDFGDAAWRHFSVQAQKHIDAGHLKVVEGRRYVLTNDGEVLCDSVVRDLMLPAK